MQNPIRSVFTLATSLCVVALGHDAQAQLDLGILQANAPQTTFSQFRSRGGDRVPLLVHLPTSDAALADAEGLLRLSPELYATRERPDALSGLIGKYPNWRWLWSPPRRLFLDKVVKNVHADIAQKDFGRTGRGVIVGIVDTGIDPTHRDLQLADGSTRVAYYLDLSQPKPLGVNVDLEKKYGCTDIDDSTGDYKAPCAVYTTSDINTLLKARSNKNLPQDAIGHGTHVASLAAGNGLSSSPPKYVGIAPEADLVVVNATRSNQGDLNDSDIILAAQFVFDVAARMGNRPAVVNLSLGSDAGAHDGTSDLEIELSKLVSTDQPGHAIVVAAGNSADLYTMYPGYPQPIGVHTSVQVLPDGNETRVPILIDSSQNPSVDSQVVAWVQTREGDHLQIGVDTQSGECMAPIDTDPLGANKTCDSISITLANGVVGYPLFGGSDARPGLFMLAEGKFEKPQALTLTFTGSGTAFIWVESAGGLTGGQCPHGACVPAGSRERTVAVPASAPDLIAVGATYNRTNWTDVNDNDVALTDIGDTGADFVGYVATFSGGGPNQLGDLKPDILAPGGFVAGAMASQADPRNPANVKYGMYDGAIWCADAPDDNCMIVDDWHAISAGTSMAAPIVTGAVALMFEANPNLTQDDARRYLQSGAQAVAHVSTPAQEGPGMLDVDGALKAQSEQPTSAAAVSGFTSWTTVSTALAHPDDNWPTRGTLHLRDAQGRAVTIDPSHIQISVSPGRLVGPIQPHGYGYYTFDFVAGEGTGRQTLYLEVRVNGQLFPLLGQSLRIGVDVPSARGAVIAGRGCSVAKPHSPSNVDFWGWCFTLSMIGVAQRRRRPSYRFDPPSTPDL